ncbi:hypothetical protein [Microlunatus sp. Y2014]|uniref:hypothetical protein n=1 Tax=Microlunatus sp. Y2014 TaxID=3418488 RepID=UPI003DA758B0
MSFQQASGSGQLRVPASEMPKGLPPETWRLICSAVAFVIGFGLGLPSLWQGMHGLVGAGSIGTVTSFTAGGLALVAFVFWYVWSARFPVNRWRRRLHPARRVLDVIGLSLTHAGITVMGLLGTFWILSQAFVDLTLDRFAGAAIVGAGCAIALYLVVDSAYTMSTRRLSELLGLFVLTGALASMLSTSEPLWWQSHFSSLGGIDDVSGFAFNITLLIAGVVIITLAGYLTHDLSRWAGRAQVERWRLQVIRIAFIGLGALLAALAFLPVSQFFLAHNIVAYSMVGFFMVLVLGVPLLFPTLSRAFSVVCWVTLGSLTLALIMYLGVGYLNLTAFELLAVGAVFAWLIMFVSSVEAAIEPDARQVGQHITTEQTTSDDEGDTGPLGAASKDPVPEPHPA